MTELWSILIGMFLGFVFGVGCALAVMYTIWTGGYKRAVEHSFMPEPPARFRSAREAILRKQAHASQR
jgi:hypothetical protein